MSAGGEVFCNWNPPGNAAACVRLKIGRHFYFLTREIPVVDAATEAHVYFYKVATHITHDGVDVKADTRESSADAMLRDLLDDKNWVVMNPFDDIA